MQIEQKSDAEVIDTVKSSESNAYTLACLISYWLDKFVMWAFCVMNENL